MKCIRTFVSVIALVAFLPLVARAANEIHWDSGQPTSPGAGKISGTGGYTVDSGMIAGIIMYATITGGGQGGQADATINNTTMTWGATILGLPKGTYNVYARMRVFQGTTPYYYDTPTKQVMVAGQ